MSEQGEINVRAQLTSDGSWTVVDLQTGSTYHSRHGARAESMHVFIGAGLHYQVDAGKKELRILEMGLGTGLNAALTMDEAAQLGLHIDYVALEAHPLPDVVWKEVAGADHALQTIHTAPWERPTAIGTQCSFTKHHCMLQDFRSNERFDLIYFDAFEPDTQPELWTEDVFKKLVEMTSETGVLVTYCAKGAVRRAMQTAGFTVERLSGPPFKREMLRAVRSS